MNLEILVIKIVPIIFQKNQKQKNFTSAADVVRELCKDALAIKKATR